MNHELIKNIFRIAYLFFCISITGLSYVEGSGFEEQDQKVRGKNTFEHTAIGISFYNSRSDWNGYGSYRSWSSSTKIEDAMIVASLYYRYNFFALKIATGYGRTEKKFRTYYHSSYGPNYSIIPAHIYTNTEISNNIPILFEPRFIFGKEIISPYLKVLIGTHIGLDKDDGQYREKSPFILNAGAGMQIRFLKWIVEADYAGGIRGDYEHDRGSTPLIGTFHVAIYYRYFSRP